MSDKKLFTASALILLLFSLISPANANWAMFHADLNRTGVAAEDWSPGSVTWNFATGGAIRASPAISGGIVYITSYDDYVYALDGVTGAKIWSYKSGGDIYASPVISDGVLYIASQDQKFYALNASTGSEIWSRSFVNGYHTSSAAVSDGMVYFGGGDGYIYALNAADGAIVWSFRTNCNPFSCPAVVDGVVYIGGMDANSGQMYALDAATGTKIWNFTAGAQYYMVYSSPAVVNGVVYFGSDDRKVYALNAATGAKIWSYQTGALTESSPAVVDGVVYIGANNHNLYALNAYTGAKIWSFSAYNCIMSSPAVLDGVVYVGSTDNNLYAINASNGYQLWSYTTGGSIYSSPAVAKGGQVYVGSNDGYLYCINAKSKSPYYQLDKAYSPDSNQSSVKQYITIYPDGSISDPNAPIVRNGNYYALTGDIGGSIRVQKDNIIIDGQGHKIFGNGQNPTGGDIDLNNRDHVTIKNTLLSGFFGTAIHMGSMDITNPQNTVGSRNCIITNNTITGGTPYYCFPIWVEGSNNSITNNHIYGNQGMGIALEKGTGHIIADNLIENNGMYGISFEYGQATVRGNRFNNNTCGPYYFTDNLMGMAPAQDIDSSNLVDGKPTYYWINQHNKAVPTDAAVVILINCSKIAVSGLNIDRGGKYNGYSIFLADTTNSIIRDNIITEGTGIRIQENRLDGSNVSVLNNTITTGIWSGRNTTIASNTFIGKGIRLGSNVLVAYNNFTDCDVAINMNGYNSTIRNNNFQNNQVAIHMYEGGYNKVYGNNFIGNTRQAEEQHSDPTRWPMTTYYTSTNNSWSQQPPVGGNFWSDHTGTDGNGDGFGDTPYHVIENYYDYYPLMQAASTVQPVSEDLSPSETAPNIAGTVNPTNNPQPTTTGDGQASGESATNTTVPSNLFLLIAITAIVAGVSAVLAGYLRHKNRLQP